MEDIARQHRSRHYNAILVSLVCLCCVALYVVDMNLDPLVGDLTRSGAYQERDYGFNQPQKRFLQQWFDKDVYDHYYDVVVVGDSFSYVYDPHPRSPILWQNFLVNETGVTLTTFNLGKGKWKSILDTKTFKQTPPKLFIYESRELRDNRLGQLTPQCGDRALLNPVKILPTHQNYAIEYYHRPLHKSMRDGNITYAKDFIVENVRRRIQRYFSTATMASEFKLTEPMFSNRLADSLLVNSKDFTGPEYSTDDLHALSCKLNALQAEIQRNGVTVFLVLIMPSKLSAYSPYLADKQWSRVSVSERLEADRFNYVRADLALKSAIQQRERDIYWPNDTHLGSKGNEIVAREIIRYLKNHHMI